MKNYNKKLLSFGIVLSLLLSCFLGVVYAKDTETIVILYENDVHCQVTGYSKLSAMKTELSEDYEYVGVVSSGDFAQGGTLGAVSKGEYIINLMNLVGYDALTLGNHEFDYYLPRLNELVDMMDTKPVSCNFYKIGEEKSYFEPYSIVSYGDVDVAYIGIISTATVASSNPAQFKNENGEFIYTFNNEDLYEIVQKNIDEVESKGADIVIALSHIGYGYESEFKDIVDIIENTEGLDVVLDAHTHSVIEGMDIQNKIGEDVLLTSTGTGFEHIGKLTISGDEITSELIKTENYEKTDKAVDDYIAQINAEYEELKNRRIGESTVALNTHDDEGNRIIRNTETNLGNLCADALKTVTNADIAYVNGGGIRSPIEVGDVTFNDIYNVFPFNNNLVVAEVTGSILKNMLEMAVMNYPAEDGSFPHVAGLTFSVNKSIPTSVQTDGNGVFTGVDGEYRVYDIKVLNKETGEYEPVEPDGVYTMAGVKYFLVDLGGGMSMFKDVETIRDVGMLDVDALEIYITKNLGGVIGEEYAELDNRITFTNGFEVSEIDVNIDWSKVPQLNDGAVPPEPVDSRNSDINGYMSVDCDGLDYYQYGWATYDEETQKWLYVHLMGDEYRISSEDRYALVFVAVLKPTHFFADKTTITGFGNAERAPGGIPLMVDYTLEIDYKITQEPSSKNRYTVSVNKNDGAAYQWFAAKTETVNVTPENVDLSLENYNEAKQSWSAVSLAPGEPYFYFGVNLNAQETLSLEFEEAVDGSVVLMCEKDEYILTPDDEGVYSYTSATPDVYVLAVISESDSVPDLAASTSKMLYTSLEGQTAKKLNTKKLKSGNYFCRVTWDMETPGDSTDDYSIDSTIVAYSAAVGSSPGSTARYAVKFDTDGGSKIANKTVTRNSKLAEPKAPTKAGFDFIGWFADKEMTDAYDFDCKVTNSFTLYAKWEKHNDEEYKTETHDCPSAAFADLDVNAWYHEYIDYVIENGIFKGAGETTFAPNENLTRAMLVTVLYRIEGEPATNRSIPFADVDMGAYYAGAVSWAKQNGIVNGATENEFAPNDNITREQIAAIMLRYAVYKGIDASQGEDVQITNYDDFGSVHKYAIPSVKWAIGSGLMKGRTDRTINPRDTATKIEVIAILHRFIKAN